jgi:hypothetical protein
MVFCVKGERGLCGEVVARDTVKTVFGIKYGSKTFTILKILCCKKDRMDDIFDDC